MNNSIDNQTVGATLSIFIKDKPNPITIHLDTTLANKQVLASFPKILNREGIDPIKITKILPRSFSEYLKATK